jgi:hypothetical protein
MLHATWDEFRVFSVWHPRRWSGSIHAPMKDHAVQLCQLLDLMEALLERIGVSADALERTTLLMNLGFLLNLADDAVEREFPPARDAGMLSHNELSREEPISQPSA